MRRRAFLVVACYALLAAPRTLRAQTKRDPIRIGWLDLARREAGARSFAIFKEALAGLGWKEGANIVIEARWADADVDHAGAIAAELAALKPAVIVVTSLRAAALASKAAPKTPIVQTGGADPVTFGLAVSFARPGKMLTGLTSLTADVSVKFFELLLAAAPAVRHVAVLVDGTAVNLQQQIKPLEHAAANYALKAHFVRVASADALESAIGDAAKQGVQALIVVPSVMFGYEHKRIVKAALGHRWPVVAAGRNFTDAGALLSYGDDRTYNYRRAAYYVDRILKGTPPGELPIEQPTTLVLTVNVRTAKALGLAIPQDLLLRADKVIE